MAQKILGEIGTDMNRFLNVDHLISLVGLCPQMHMSADCLKPEKDPKAPRCPLVETTLGQADLAMLPRIT